MQNAEYRTENSIPAKQWNAGQGAIKITCFLKKSNQISIIYYASEQSGAK